MHLGERRKILNYATIPNSGIRARFMRSYYARVEHKEVVGGDGHTDQLLILIRRYCGMKRPGPTLHVHAHETDSTD